MLTEASEKFYAHIKRLESRIKDLEDESDMEHLGYKESEEESGDSLG